MLAVHCLASLKGNVRRAVFPHGLTQFRHGRKQRRVIALERDNVISLLFDDGGDRLFLRIEGIQRDDAALQRQHFEQLRHGGNLVGVSRNFDLAERQTLRAGPSTDQFDGSLAVAALVRFA
jgi:hypothetical protein